MLTKTNICAACGQPIAPTGLRLPPIKQRIYEAVLRRFGLRCESVEEETPNANDEAGSR
jgi:hypothetical protein